MAASVEGPVELPDPSSPSSIQLSFAECRQAARSVRRAECGRQAIAYVRPRNITGLHRNRPPLTLLLYLLSRQNLVVWRSPEEFVALRPPDAATMSGDRPAVQLRRLDRWWDIVVQWLLPLLALSLATSLAFVTALLWPALLLAVAVYFYGIILMLALILRSLLWLYRRLTGSESGRHAAGERLVAQNWSISLFHVTDPRKVEDLLQAARDRVGTGTSTAGSGHAQDVSGTLVCDARCITTSAAHDAACVTTEVTRITETDINLLILHALGNRSVPRVGDYRADPVRVVALYLSFVVIVTAAQAYAVSDYERAACGMQCAGRPASYGDALDWLLSLLVLRGGPGDLSAGTTAARVIGASFTSMVLVGIVIVAVACVQAARAYKKNAQELEETVRRSLEASVEATRGSVFINYRSGDEDTLFIAEFRRRISDIFGSAKVFFDIRSMPPGTRYPDDLRENLYASRVLIAVIQRDWLEHLDQRKNEAGTDWVRFEISTALSSGKTVIPVLLNDVKLPTSNQLPADIADLAMRQACRLRWTSLDEDMARLIAAIEPHLRVHS